MVGVDKMHEQAVARNAEPKAEIADGSLGQEGEGFDFATEVVVAVEAWR